jgi:hypothetical protein
MKNFTHAILGFFLILSLQGVAQLCGFDHRHEEMLKNEAFAKQMIQNEEQIQRLIQSGNLNPRLNSDLPYTIPVVFHVIHTGGAIGSSYNPSDADLIAMLNYTNQVFAGTAAGMSGGVGNMQVQFALAKRDPNCNPTTGIVRVNGSGVSGYAANGVRLFSTGVSELSIKNLSRWNTSQYYNIWIVNKFDGADGLDGNPVIAGFANFPGGSANVDGAMMLAAFAEDGNKVLPHELGHALNLYHPFQGSSNSGQCPANSNCATQGDRVCDTDPISSNVTGGVTSFVCRTGNNPCTGTPYSINTENNIMSYTECFTLFTAGQKERVLAAMLLADRLSLTTSPGATAPSMAPVCAPKINFVLTAANAPEAPNNLVDCRRYTDYVVPMNIASAPSQNASVSVSVNGGTALNAYDFILTTNDDFNTPSNVLTFPTGSFANRSFKIRVFDDAYIEGNETIIVGFSVAANGGNALKGEGITEMTINITDNDAEPKQQEEKVDVVGSIQYTLGTAADGSHPLNPKLAQKKNAWIIRANELTARGFKAGTITAIALNIQKNSTRPYQNFQIKMGATAANYLIDGGAIVVPTSTVRSIPNFNTVNGWNTIALDAPFAWNGTSNVCIELCYQNDAAEESQSSDVTIGYTDGGSATQASFYFQSDRNCATSFSSVNSYINGVKPTTRFVMIIPQNQTETLLNASTNGYLGPFGEMYFYTATGNILAKIKNLTNWDYGCTEVKIDRAGNGTKAFVNDNTANAITDKTISVIPTNNNPAGQYEITLFYRPDEVAGYKTATGTLWQDAGMVKATNAISSYTPGSVPSGETTMGGSVVKGFYGADSTIKATFTGSFSGFGVVPSATVLPVNWLSFNGKVVRGNAELDWSTASEQHNSHFDVEISRDASGFAKIGTVKGAGTSNQVSHYAFSHIKPLAGINYYRIRQVDKDGRSSLSQVIGLRSETSGEAPSLYPNPASSKVMLDWGEMAGQPGRWDLLTPDMKALKSGQSAFTSAVQGISIGELPAGVYYLKLSSGKQVKVLRFVKQ